MKESSGLERAIVLVAAVAIACMWIVTVERARFEQSEAASDAWRQTSNIAIAVEQHAIATLDDIEQTLALVVREYELHGAPPPLQALFDNGAIASGLYNLFLIIDERGDLVAASAATATAPINVADRDYFAFHRDHPGDEIFIGLPVVGRATGNLIVPISRRVNKPDGSFGGVAVASIDPQYFASFYGRLDVGATGLIALVGLDGIARVRRVGDANKHGEDMRGTVFYREMLANGTGTLLGPGYLDGVRRYISYRRLARHALAVEVGFDATDALKNFTVRERAYFAGSGAATVLFLAVAGMFIVASRRQRRANEALLRNEARFRATFDQAAVGISHVGLDGRFLSANDRFCDMHGHSNAELERLTVFDTTHPDDRPRLTALGRALLANAQPPVPPTFEMRHIRKDGSTMWVSVAVALVRDSAGRPEYFATIAEDITARKAAEERYRATFNQVAVGIAHVSLDGRFIDANVRLAQILGYEPSEMASLRIDDILLPQGLAAARDARNKLHARELECSIMEFDYVRKDGSRGAAMRTLSPVRDASGDIEYFITVVQDISERKLAEAALARSNEQFEQLVNHIPQAFWIVDVGARELVYLSPAYEKLCGVRFDSLRQAMSEWSHIVHEDDRARMMHAAGGMHFDVVDERFRIVRPDGAARWLHLRGFPVRDASGGVHRVAGTLEDITERQNLVERLEYQAHYDALTGLPNRVLFVDRLRQTLSRAKRRGWLAAVLFLDLDRFKLVNDTLGHVFGDQLLQQVSHRLSSCVRGDDTVGRLGGDEFAVVLAELGQSQDACLVAQKVLDALAQPFRLDGHEVYITASIGIATYPGDGGDAEALLKNADAAMFSAKTLGKNNYQFYTAAMNARAFERLLLESNLRRALERNEFVLHLQAQASIETGAIVGCEALLRWQVAGDGLLPPAQFIPLLEESGLIVPVGEWVVRSACAQIRAWCDAGLPAVPIAVNLSARQFQHQALRDVIERALFDYAIDPRLLELEITETVAMQNAEEAIVTLTGLKALGVRIAIDDFGTGYSSLNYLKQLPVDALKLDRTFVKDLPTDADDVAIARAVIHLAHTLDLEVVAEGVESRAQLAFLAANGCDVAQGYYLSRPLPAAQFAQLLAERGRLPAPGADDRAEQVVSLA